MRVLEANNDLLRYNLDSSNGTPGWLSGEASAFG